MRSDLAAIARRRQTLTALRRVQAAVAQDLTRQSSDPPHPQRDGPRATPGGRTTRQVA